MAHTAPRIEFVALAKNMSRLLRALPADFRANFGHEMEGVFAEQKREIETCGAPLDFLKLWWETFLGIFRTAPREHWDILQAGLRVCRTDAGEQSGVHDYRGADFGARNWREYGDFQRRAFRVAAARCLITKGSS